MKLHLPLVWDDRYRLVLDADGNSVSPAAIVSRLSLHDDMVRAIDILNYYRPPDLPLLAASDVEQTLLRIRALDKQ